MKKITLCAFILSALCACTDTKNSSGFEIKGTLSNSKSEPIYLEKLGQKGVDVVDSAVINEKGEFVMNSYSPSIGFYRLRLTDANFAMLVLDSGQKVNITGDARLLGNNYSVEGSPDTKLYLEYNTLAQDQKVRTDSLENIFRTAIVTMNVH